MRIAVPVLDGNVSPHFGHSISFTIMGVDQDAGSITRSAELPSPTQMHGVLLEWLREQNVDIVIAGGIGEKASALLGTAGIRVIAGIEPDQPVNVVSRWIAGDLQTRPDCGCQCKDDAEHECQGHAHRLAAYGAGKCR